MRGRLIGSGTQVMAGPLAPVNSMRVVNLDSPAQRLTADRTLRSEGRRCQRTQKFTSIHTVCVICAICGLHRSATTGPAVRSRI
jgi:hypothetical protein